jgi:hypothetical protein
MLRRIRNNAGMKILSVALALGAWWYLRFAANPAIAAHFDQQLSVPIVATGLAADEVARFTEKQAVITINTPRDSTAPVRPDDFRAFLKVSGRGPGVHSVPVTVVGPLEVKSATPASVTLQIARVGSRREAVSVRYVGDPRTVVANAVVVTPPSLLVGGADDDLARVVGVRVDVAFPAQPQAVDAMMRPVPIDVHGDEVTGVHVAPNLVRVRVGFAAAKHAA